MMLETRPATKPALHAFICDCCGEVYSRGDQMAKIEYIGHDGKLARLRSCFMCLSNGEAHKQAGRFGERRRTFRPIRGLDGKLAGIYEEGG